MYTFEPAFLPSLGPGHLGAYLIPWGPSAVHDEVRMQAILDSHDVESIKWDATEDGQLVGLYGGGPQLSPCERFVYMDADLVIYEAEFAAMEAASETGRRVYTLDEIEELKRQGLA